jgi:hypothetical protein
MHIRIGGGRSERRRGRRSAPPGRLPCSPQRRLDPDPDDGERRECPQHRALRGRRRRLLCCSRPAAGRTDATEHRRREHERPVDVDEDPVPPGKLAPSDSHPPLPPRRARCFKPILALTHRDGPYWCPSTWPQTECSKPDPAGDENFLSGAGMSRATPMLASARGTPKGATWLQPEATQGELSRAVRGTTIGRTASSTRGRTSSDAPDNAPKSPQPIQARPERGCVVRHSRRREHESRGRVGWRRGRRRPPFEERGGDRRKF